MIAGNHPSTSVPDPSDSALVRMQLAREYALTRTAIDECWRRSDSRTGAHLASRAIGLATQIFGDPSLELAEALADLGRFYQGDPQKVPEARESLQLAESTLRRLTPLPELRLGSILAIRGEFEIDAGQTGEGIRFLHLAAQQFEKSLLSVKSLEEKCDILAQIGDIVFTKVRCVPLAPKAIQGELSRFSSTTRRELPPLMSSLVTGSLLEKLGFHNEANEGYLAALSSWIQEGGHPSSEAAQIFYMLGQQELRDESGDRKSALEYFRRAREEATRVESTDDMRALIASTTKLLRDG